MREESVLLDDNEQSRKGGTLDNRHQSQVTDREYVDNARLQQPRI
jgi:hypothetical protein